MEKLKRQIVNQIHAEMINPVFEIAVLKMSVNMQHYIHSALGWTRLSNVVERLE